MGKGVVYGADSSGVIALQGRAVRVFAFGALARYVAEAEDRDGVHLVRGDDGVRAGEVWEVAEAGFELGECLGGRRVRAEAEGNDGLGGGRLVRKVNRTTRGGGGGETHYQVWPRHENNKYARLRCQRKLLDGGEQRLDLIGRIDYFCIEFNPVIYLVIDPIHRLGDNAKVVASAPERPEQIGIRRVGHSDHFPTGRHKLHRDDVVDHEAVEALQTPMAAAKTCAEHANTIADPDR